MSGPDQDTVAVKYGDRTWTWREHIAEATAQAAALIAHRRPDRPLHVGVLLGNTPDMLTALAAAALGGYVLCGINTTRRGDALGPRCRPGRLSDPDHRRGAPRTCSTASTCPVSGCSTCPGTKWAALPAQRVELTPHREVAPDDTFMMIFTSGTSGDPKAVQVPAHGADSREALWSEVFGLTPRRLLPVDAAVSLERRRTRAGRVALVTGAAMVPAKFSASRFLDDVRRYGVTS